MYIAAIATAAAAAQTSGMVTGLVASVAVVGAGVISKLVMDRRADRLVGVSPAGDRDLAKDQVRQLNQRGAQGTYRQGHVPRSMPGAGQFTGKAVHEGKPLNG